MNGLKDHAIVPGQEEVSWGMPMGRYRGGVEFFGIYYEY